MVACSLGINRSLAATANETGHTVSQTSAIENPNLVMATPPIVKAGDLARRPTTQRPVEYDAPYVIIVLTAEEPVNATQTGDSLAFGSSFDIITRMATGALHLFTILLAQ